MDQAEILSSRVPAERRAASSADLTGPLQTIDDFYRRELPGLAALAQVLCGSAAADAIAQEAMIAAYRRWSALSTNAHPEAWARRACATTATSLLRSRVAEARAVWRWGARPSAGPMAPAHEEFWGEVRRLPKRRAQAAALRHLYDLSTADIAATLRCSERSVQAYLSRAGTVLAARFDEVGEEGS